MSKDIERKNICVYLTGSARSFFLREIDGTSSIHDEIKKTNQRTHTRTRTHNKAKEEETNLYNVSQR